MRLTHRNNASMRKRFLLLIAIEVTIILLLTFTIYLPSFKNEFIRDDEQYICENTKIQLLNSHSLYWMSTSFYAANWHPLTWLSHAIDYSLWDLNPGGHRSTNLVLHGFNTLLVFFLVVALMMRAKKLNRTTPLVHSTPSISSDTLIAAGVTSLLFGVHPLHVESVAWIAERKDLLCCFFFLLSILSYLPSTSLINKRHQVGWFTTSLLLFLLALMSKPMAVSLPLILLLIDFYPLKRMERDFKNTSKLLIEKIPFLMASLASGILTIFAQHSGGAIKSFEQIPLGFRLGNALHSLLFYLKKMARPFELNYQCFSELFFNSAR